MTLLSEKEKILNLFEDSVEKPKGLILTENEKIFFSLIKKLNDNNDYTTHYYDLENNFVMKIDFDKQHWRFSIIEIEKIK